MGSYRRAIIILALPLPREMGEVIYLAQKPLFMYLDQFRRSRIKRSEILRLVDHPSCCICSTCYRIDSTGCKIILNYIMPALPDRGILDDPERRGTLMSILRRLKSIRTTQTLKSLIDSGRLPWGKAVCIFDGTHQDIISPTELMEELRDSVPLSMYNSQSL